MKKTVLTFIVCSLLTYVLSFACAFFGFIGPVFWVGIGVPAALLCAFPMVYLLGKNRIPGQMILTFNLVLKDYGPLFRKGRGYDLFAGVHS